MRGSTLDVTKVDPHAVRVKKLLIHFNLSKYSALSVQVTFLSVLEILTTIYQMCRPQITLIPKGLFLNAVFFYLFEVGN